MNKRRETMDRHEARQKWDEAGETFARITRQHFDTELQRLLDEKAEQKWDEAMQRFRSLLREANRLGLTGLEL